MTRLSNLAEYILIGLILAAILWFIVNYNFAIAAKPTTQSMPEILLTTKNSVLMAEVFDDNSVGNVQEELQRLHNIRGKKAYPIYLVIDSPGGSISAGLDLIVFANSLGNIHTISLDVASMGAITAQLVKGNRYITEDSTMMFHRASIGGLGGQIDEGEVESRVKYLKAKLKSITTRVAARLGLTYKQLQDKQKDEYWLYGTEIKNEKAADLVVEVKCTKQLVAKKITSIKQVFFFQIVIERSACPLLKMPTKASGEK